MSIVQRLRTFRSRIRILHSGNTKKSAAATSSGAAVVCEIEAAEQDSVGAPVCVPA
jgi:hypothetical protein